MLLYLTKGCFVEWLAVMTLHFFLFFSRFPINKIAWNLDEGFILVWAINGWANPLYMAAPFWPWFRGFGIFLWDSTIAGLQASSIKFEPWAPDLQFPVRNQQGELWKGKKEVKKGKQAGVLTSATSLSSAPSPAWQLLAIYITKKVRQGSNLALLSMEEQKQLSSKVLSACLFLTQPWEEL